MIAMIALPSIAVLCLGIWVFARLLRSPAPKETKLLAEAGSASSYTIIVGTQSATGAATTEPPRAAAGKPVIHIKSPATTHTNAQVLQKRAEAAEQKAERAHEAIRSGVVSQLSHWMKQKFVRRLLAERSEMLETQQNATMKALRVEERLAKIEIQIDLQNQGYQRRIDELTKELIAAKEENRELIRTQIRQVKAEMEEARARMLAQAKIQAGE
jgi:hypothetical protein